ncbi:MAG: aminotransferase class V-fold PLP-dependent enzyme [Nanobdellota archaeon]
MGIGNDLIGNTEELLVSDVIRSRNVFRFSKEDYLPYTFIFEKQVKEMLNVSGVIMFPSATTALMAFLKTIKFKEKDEVIISPMSWVADYSALLFENIKMRFCEIDNNLQIIPESIKKLINKNTKMVIIPHIMGRGQQDIDKIAGLCKENNIILVEDIAQAFGVKIKGKYAGSFGDFSFSSFNHHKLISTGDGGIAIVNNEEKYKEICQIHDQGCFIDEIGKRSIVPEQYNKGLSLRVNNLTGALALAQLSRFALLKSLILEKYNSLVDLLTPDERKKIIPANKGDIPYTLLLKSKKNSSYPSLLQSGWHFIENIPYYKKIKTDKKDKDNIKNSKKVIESTYAIGAGFIDKYYAIREGTEIDKEIDIKNIRKTIKEIL